MAERDFLLAEKRFFWKIPFKSSFFLAWFRNVYTVNFPPSNGYNNLLIPLILRLSPNILNKMVTHPIRIIHPKYRPNGRNHQQTTSQNFLSSFGSITRSYKSVEAFAELSSQVWPNSILGKLDSCTPMHRTFYNP